MSLACSVLTIARKWYSTLQFAPVYDALFEELCRQYPALPEEKIANYPFDPSNDAGLHLLMCLYFCEELEDTYRRAGIPHSILLDGLHDLVIWTDMHYSLSGQLGVSEVNWLKFTFQFRLFTIGRLQYMLAPCVRDIPEIGVKQGAPVLEIHIPQNGPLYSEKCLDSMEAAKAFFATYFPDAAYKCFTCFSWLLDDTLLDFMREDSNIIKFQRLFTPVFKKESLDVLRFTLDWSLTADKIPHLKPTNSFTQAAKDAVMAGQKFYAVLGFRLT